MNGFAMNYSNLLSRPHQQRPLNMELLRRINRIRKASSRLSNKQQGSTPQRKGDEPGS
jgi:hypothetical protein